MNTELRVVSMQNAAASRWIIRIIVAGTHWGTCLYGDIDKLSPLASLVGNCALAATCKRRDNVGNSVAWTTIESVKFVYGNGCVLLSGEFCGGLADTAIVVNNPGHGAPAALSNPSFVREL